MKSSWLEAPSASSALEPTEVPSVENLVKKSTRDGSAGVQKLRQSNDVARKQQQSLVNIKGLPEGVSFVCSMVMQTKCSMPKAQRSMLIEP
jgi:hypothetical protein